VLDVSSHADVLLVCSRKPNLNPIVLKLILKYSFELGTVIGVKR
jgi:hypothetical protein